MWGQWTDGRSPDKVSTEEHNALFKQRPFDYHTCYQAKKLNKGSKLMYRDDACFPYQKEHMFKDNRRQLTGKCKTQNCQSLWKQFEEADEVLPVYSVCDQVRSNHLQKSSYEQLSCRVMNDMTTRTHTCIKLLLPQLYLT